MIQFKRGNTTSWRGAKEKLAPGQPGYDKNKHKIKIGDGDTEWSELPYASGLHAEEILCSETEAKNRDNNDKFAINIITYGTETPDENTIGQIYLQQIDEPEVDYIVESGTNGIWTYQKWKSGVAKCWGNYSFKTSVLEPLEFGCKSIAISTSYPFEFKYTPTEVATIQSSGGQMVVLANTGANTIATSGSYTLISLIAPLEESTYYISIQVEGFYK